MGITFILKSFIVIRYFHELMKNIFQLFLIKTLALFDYREKERTLFAVYNNKIWTTLAAFSGKE